MMMFMEIGMIDTREIEYEGDPKSIRVLQDFLGKRPGNYRVDPFYIRTGIAGKPYLWDDYNRRWVMLRKGDVVGFDADGIPTKVVDKNDL